MTPNQKPSSAEIADVLEKLVNEAVASGAWAKLAHTVIDESSVILAALRSAAPPRGVPREPTPDMLKAAHEYFSAKMLDYWPGDETFTEIWQSMYDAAPSDRDREDAERYRALCAMVDAYGLAINPLLDHGSLRSMFWNGRALTAHIDAAIASAKGGTK